MAYTKTPEQDTHKTVRIPSLGSSFPVANSAISEPTTLNYLDCFPEGYRQFGGDPLYRVVKREAFVRDRHSVTTNASTSIAWGGIVPAMLTDNVFFGRGLQIYALSWNAGAPSITSALTSASLINYGQGSATNAVDDAGDNVIAFLGGITPTIAIGYESGTGFVETALSPALNPEGGLVFLNGYLFACSASGRIYNSGVGGALDTWSTTDFLSAEIFPDPVIYLAKHHNHLVAFGTQTIEFFYDNAVEVGSPLARAEGYTAQIGLLPALPHFRHLACIKDDIYFLGRTGPDVGLYRLREFKFERVSTKYVEDILSWNNTYGFTTDGSAPAIIIQGVEIIYVHNRPMVRIWIDNATYHPVFDPTSGAWWMLSAGYEGSAVVAGNAFTSTNWTSTNAPDRTYHRSWRLTANATNSTTLLIGSPDLEHSVSVTSSYISDNFDAGVNNQRHLKYLDCIGDYGNNTMTVTIRPNDRGFNNPIPLGPMPVRRRYYNLGRHRSASFAITMTGTDIARHEAFEVTYNMGSY
jgi:hypothetical protein